MPLQLPKILESIQKKVEATLTHTVRIHPKAPAPDGLWQSKIGGKPYWPKSLDYPQSSEGSFLFFLAQLNFSEIPKLEGFPEKGILQFFIANDGTYGANFEQPESQDGFRVVYHPEVVKDDAQLETAFAFLPPFDQETPIPDSVAYQLDFQLAEEWLGPPDYQFDQVFPEDFLAGFGDSRDEMMDFFYELGSQSSGHKMGGYAFFTQYDPRNSADPMLLLFQMDSDSEIDCMWGDMGIANFFIRQEDLKSLRFDRVLYNWDCA